MIISPTHNFIFFKPMKCAGSSIEYSLLQACEKTALCTGGTPEEIAEGYKPQNNGFAEDGEEKYKFHPHTWPSLFLERTTSAHQWKDYKKISVVRNPWDTVVSWYWWAMAASPASQFVIRHDDDKLTTQWKFETFLNLVCRHNSVRPEIEKVNCTPLDYVSQTNELFIDGNMSDYIKFESLDVDYSEICHQLKLEKYPLCRFKSVQRKIKRHYSHYYNTSTRNAVVLRFPKTIEKFNYHFEEEN